MSLYDIFIIGAGPSNEATELKRLLKQSVQDLGVSVQHARFLSAADISNRNPLLPHVAACLLPFSSDGETIAATQLVQLGVPIIPIVHDLRQFTKQAPPVLHKFNGIEVGADGSRLPAAAAAMLEWLGLLRKQRRLFISYRRQDSRTAALQLHDHLQAAGFDVFLDTHGVRPGDDFQAILTHRMMDCEVVLLIDTPGFLTSRWTVEELARADLKSIGILQLIWPGHNPPRKSPLSDKLYLDAAEVLGADGPLSDGVVERITMEIEKLRSRAVATRTAAIALEYRKQAEAKGARVYLEKGKLLRTELKDGKVIVAVPALGIPTSDHLHEVFEAAQAMTKERPILVYDHHGVLERWLKHLDWLDEHLPVRALKVDDTWKELA
jgi:hypothetical protein